jgi:hypothetical protein
MTAMTEFDIITVVFCAIIAVVMLLLITTLVKK